MSLHYIRTQPPPELVELFTEHPHPESLQTWEIADDGSNERYGVIVSRDSLTVTDERWHISVAGQTQVPSWQIMSGVAHQVRPGVPFVIGVPPKSWWLNLHPHTLHLWECKDQALIDSWRSERRGESPT